MEQFVKSLFDRLDANGQMQLICIMENAINEIHNNGIISQVDISGTSKLHDPDPNVRVTEKNTACKGCRAFLCCFFNTGNNRKRNRPYN